MKIQKKEKKGVKIILRLIEYRNKLLEKKKL